MRKGLLAESKENNTYDHMPSFEYIVSESFKGVYPISNSVLFTSQIDQPHEFRSCDKILTSRLERVLLNYFPRIQEKARVHVTSPMMKILYVPRYVDFNNSQ